MISRRELHRQSAAVLAGAAAVSGRAQAASIPGGAEHGHRRPCSRRSCPASGPDYQPVVTLNGWTLPWRMNGDWKEFHLVAEPVVREIAPGMKAHLWGYNGQSPGPTIEAVEGDKVRIFVTNKLPEHTTVHWHGMLLPNGMDGVGGLTQPHIKPGKTFVYEFVLQEERHVHVPPARRRDGADGDGHDGLLRRPSARSEASCASIATSSSCSDAYDIDPGSYMPKVMTMTDFNLWTWNSRVFPGHRPSGGAQGRPRARAHRQSHHDQPSDPHARLPFRGDLHRRRLGAGERALAGGHDRRSGRRHARLRVRRRRARRLGDPLPQVAPHHERHGPQREDLHRRAASATSRARSASSCPTTCRWARPAWPRWARWKCRCPTTRCR